MTKKQLEYRLWSLISITNAYKHLELTPLKSDRIRRHRSGNKPLADWEFTSIAKIVGVASELQMYTNNSRGITVSQIASECPQIKAKEGKLGLFVVDYWQEKRSKEDQVHSQANTWRYSRSRVQEAPN